ncbi:MAG: beta-lactamase family protein [Acidimicrobiia bacterium]|nr:beta-lactamase family protein [Acidimicrobiia bacterium]
MMRNTRRRPVLALWLALAVVASGCSSGDGGPAGLDDALAELRDSSFSGVVLVASRGDVTVEGFGNADRADTIPNGPETVFDIGSLTKQFTGAAILRLEMDGQLSTDDTLSTYLPNLTPEQQDITLHELLTHTAGLPDALGSDYEPVARDAYLQLVVDTPLLQDPGQLYRYSNVGYSLLAAVIEVVTGDSYESYLQETLFEPAGMTSTGYVLPDWDDRIVAVGYDGDRPAGRPHELPWADDGPYWHLRGNGGLLSTADDMYRWHEALLGNDILDDEAKAKYYGRHVTEGPGAQTYYGYGWALFPTPSDTWLVTHNGGNGIFFADFLRFLDEDLTIFVATNSASTADEDVAFRIADAVLGHGLVSPEEDDACALSDVDLDLLATLTAIDELPATAAGATAAELFALLGGSDDAARRDYVTHHVADELRGELTIDELAEALRQVQVELDGLPAEALYQEDDLSFHVVMGAPATGLGAIVSIRLDETDPTKVRCVGVAA